jgi:hypothetical protein
VGLPAGKVKEPEVTVGLINVVVAEEKISTIVTTYVSEAS